MGKDPFKEKLERHIGQRVRLLRTERGFTLEELAEYANISRNHLSNIERGKTSMTSFMQAKLAKGLDLSHPHELTNDAYNRVYPTMNIHRSD
ncbi:helix-turn-helix domain-containing protein [Halalkalibacter sp. APA_J-10(15)]|uniref:helix-turn-helix domain-containing protein n=1 Tax=Halalkalibacter sp. APA_J-10(15) TaxID=2933805 RepID=UPI001FF64A40|nr:helix-turn-helix transcriptional regulator [Halalkalibacter sp. APA_J-10(15)]MCK0470098.1 helix-turn-helix domain-containing protein [Halalkalibacter sp. APA_J-10(15)]